MSMRVAITMTIDEWLLVLQLDDEALAKLEKALNDALDGINTARNS